MDTRFTAQYDWWGLVTPSLLLDFEEKLLDVVDFRVHTCLREAFLQVVRALGANVLSAMLIFIEQLALLFPGILPLGSFLELVPRLGFRFEKLEANFVTSVGTNWDLNLLAEALTFLNGFRVVI